MWSKVKFVSDKKLVKALSCIKLFKWDQLNQIENYCWIKV